MTVGKSLRGVGLVLLATLLPELVHDEVRALGEGSLFTHS